MSAKNIYIPDDLRRKMRQFPYVNWSAIAQKAWARHLGLIVIPRTKTKVEKLRRAA